MPRRFQRERRADERISFRNKKITQRMNICRIHGISERFIDRKNKLDCGCNIGVRHANVSTVRCINAAQRKLRDHYEEIY